MPMSDGQLKSLAVVAEKLREQEAPLRERQDSAGLGIGAAALLVEMAGEEIQQLRQAIRTMKNTAKNARDMIDQQGRTAKDVVGLFERQIRIAREALGQPN